MGRQNVLPLDLFHHRKLNVAKSKTTEQKASNIPSPSGTAHQVTMTCYREQVWNARSAQRASQLAALVWL